MSERLDDFAGFCSELVLDNGERMLLEPFQREIVADYFAGATETLMLISKKNGKTTLLAALALFHLLTTQDAECVVAAASRDQATILYDQAVGFVRRTPALRAARAGAARVPRDRVAARRRPHPRARRGRRYRGRRDPDAGVWSTSCTGIARPGSTASSVTGSGRGAGRW